MHQKLFAIFVATISVVFVNGASAETRSPVSVPERALSTTAALLANPQKTKECVVGPFRKYDHKSGWLSLAVPDNWAVTDKSVEGEVIISIADPTQNCIVVIRVYRAPRLFTQSELGQTLQTFLNDRLASFNGFTMRETMGETKSQRDGSLGRYFKYNSTLEGVTYPMYGDAFIEQHNGLIGVLALIMAQDQYDAKQKASNEMINSFRVTGTNP